MRFTIMAERTIGLTPPELAGGLPAAREGDHICRSAAISV